MTEIHQLRDRLISACSGLGISFAAVADPVRESDNHVNMTFSAGEEDVADSLIRRVRALVAAHSPEDLMLGGASAPRLGVQVHKSFVCSNGCWAVWVELSSDGYKLTESVEG